MIEEKIIKRNNIILKNLINEYKYSKKAIEVKFRDLIPELNNKDRYTHLIHTYPAKLLVHIPYFFLNNTLLSKKKCFVLDPFIGTGTVFLEAIVSGRNVYGADSNPLARLIASVKTTRYDTNELKKTLETIIYKAKRSNSNRIPEVINCSHWFPEKNTKYLGKLLFQINKIEDINIKSFFLVCFSNCIKKVSYADPRVSVPVKININKYEFKNKLKSIAIKRLNLVENIDVLDKFNLVTLENIKRFERIETINNTNISKIISNDARYLTSSLNSNKLLKSNSVQLIITSPPYAGAQKYIRSSSLNLNWTELADINGLKELDKKNIGRETYPKAENFIVETGILKADNLIKKIAKINPSRAKIACQYLIEMKKAIDEMIRVLKVNGFIILIIGNNKICNYEFLTHEYLSSYILSKGLSDELKLIDAINSYGLMTKRNKTADIISREYILLFKKQIE